MINKSIILERLLEQYNITVESITNPRDGIEKAVNLGYDIIFVDHEMEEMTGEEVVKKLEASGNKIPPVVGLLTGITEVKDIKNFMLYVMNKRQELGYKLNRNNYVTKTMPNYEEDEKYIKDGYFVNSYGNKLDNTFAYGPFNLYPTLIHFSQSPNSFPSSSINDIPSQYITPSISSTSFIIESTSYFILFFLYIFI